MKLDANNIIPPSTVIPDFVVMGKYNRFGENVTIQVLKGSKKPILEIGDCNIINDNVKIIVGDAGVYIKDWNVIHNNIFINGEDQIEIGHNCWFGQNSILDGSGKLSIGNGVRVGMYSQIWTHVASGEQIEGCILFSRRETRILNDVWLVGSCIVGSGITLGERSIFLINSVVTKDADGGRVYSGSPAKLMEKANFYKKISIVAKFDMMYNWANQFAELNKDIQVQRPESEKLIIIDQTGAQIIFSNTYDMTISVNEKTTIFHMDTKTFIKRYTPLERSFYHYIYNNKARFTPLN